MRKYFSIIIIILLLYFTPLDTNTIYRISYILFFSFFLVPVLQAEQNDCKSVCIQNTTLAPKRTGYYTIKNKIQYNGKIFWLTA